MENNKPETKIKIGAISASVWKRTHKTQDGREFDRRQVSIDRAYKDKEGNWKNVTSFDANDIPKVVLALQEAYALIVKNSEASSSDSPTVTVEDVN